MANIEKIDNLLLDIKELEKTITLMRDAEVLPVSFFSNTFELTHKILNDIHQIESNQIEILKKQMEEHLSLIKSIPLSTPIQHPTEPESIPTVAEVVEEVKESDQVIAKQINSEAIFTSTEKNTTSTSLHDILEKKKLSDFRKAFSLNDRFLFKKELFGGDEDKMNKTISDLNDIHSYEESIAYLNNVLKWNIEDTNVVGFIKLLEKRFL